MQFMQFADALQNVYILTAFLYSGKSSSSRIG